MSSAIWFWGQLELNQHSCQGNARGTGSAATSRRHCVPLRDASATQPRHCLGVCAYTCGSAPSDIFLWIFQTNSYTNGSSTTWKLTFDHSSECSQAWVKQKCKCKHSAKPFPLGSTTYRHSLSLGKNCSTSQLQVISHTGDPWASPSSSSSLFLICKSQVHLFQADMLFATSWYRFLPSSILSLCIPVLNTYKVTSRLSSHLPELPVSRFNRGR